MARLLSVIGFECRHQLFRLSTLAVMAVIVGYTLVMTLGSQAVAELSLADTPRNSAYVIYIMAAPGGFWFLFFAAFVMSTAISRDRDVQLAEVIYAAPGSLRSYLLGLFLGRLLTVFIVSLSIPLAFVIMPLFSGADAAIGPTPWASLVHGYGVFLFVLVLSLCGLYFGLAVLTGSSALPWVAAFVLTVVWMVSDLMLISADILPALGHLLDPIQHALVQMKIDQWTAEERQSGVVAITPLLLANRLAYLGLGLGATVLALLAPNRETLLSRGGTGHGRKPKKPTAAPDAQPLPAPKPALKVPTPAVGGYGSLALQLSAIHTSRLLRSGAFAILIGFAVMTLVTTGALKIQGTEAGPIQPWTWPVWIDFYRFMYLPAGLFLCYGVSRLIDGERSSRFSELIDATPAPGWMLILPKAVAMILVALILAAIPGIALAMVQALLFPVAFDPVDMVASTLLFSWPIYIQIGLLAFVIYGLVTHSATAHFLAFFGVCVLIFNQETRLADTSLALYGMLIHAEYSHLLGWRMWVEPALLTAAWFIGLGLTGLIAAAYLWPRGTGVTWVSRFTQHGARGRAAFAGLSIGTLALTAAAGFALYRTVMVDNVYRSDAASIADQAAYELAFGADRAHALPAILEARTTIQLDLDRRSAAIRHALSVSNEGRTPIETILVEWPEAVTVQEVSADGTRLDSTGTEQHLRTARLHLPDPLSPGETITLDFALRAVWRGFKNLGEAHPVSPAGAWLSGADLLPKIGYQRAREIKNPALRQAHGLPPRHAPSDVTNRPYYPQNAYPNEIALAVTSRRTPTVRLSGQPVDRTALRHRFSGRDFAIVAGAYTATDGHWQKQGGSVRIELLHHPLRAAVADSLLREAKAVLTDYAERFGPYTGDRLTIVQAPNHLMPTGLYGNILVLEEDEGWDANSAAGVFPALRFHLARALAQHWWHDRLQPVARPGHALLTDGLPAYAALSYVADSRDPGRFAYLQSLPEAYGPDLLQMSADAPAASRLSDEAPDGTAAYLGALIWRAAETGAPDLDNALKAALRDGSPVTLPPALAGPLTLFDIGFAGTPQQTGNGIEIRLDGRKLAFADNRWSEAALSGHPVEIGFLSADGDLTELTRVRLRPAEAVSLALPPDGAAVTALMLDPRGLLADINPRDNYIAVPPPNNTGHDRKDAGRRSPDMGLP